MSAEDLAKLSPAWQVKENPESLRWKSGLECQILVWVPVPGVGLAGAPASPLGASAPVILAVEKGDLSPAWAAVVFMDLPPAAFCKWVPCLLLD